MFCNKCGKEIPNDSRVCKFCGSMVNQQQTINYNFNSNTNTTNTNTNIKKKIYQQWWFWLIIVFLIIGLIGTAINQEEANAVNQEKANSSNVQTNNKENTQKNTNTQQTNEKSEVSKADYQKQCKKYDYNELARNPNKYKGQKIKFTGEVIQVQEGWFNSVTLRVNVTKGEYGFWEDTIWVDYTYSDENESKILKDDIIDIYGEFKRQKTYTTVLGSSMSIPQIDAKYISLNKNK